MSLTLGKVITYPPELLPRAEGGAEVWVCTAPNKCKGDGTCANCRLVSSTASERRTLN